MVVIQREGARCEALMTNMVKTAPEPRAEPSVSVAALPLRDGIMSEISRWNRATQAPLTMP